MTAPAGSRPADDWPSPLRRAVDGIATVFMQAYMIARERAARSASPRVREMARRDDAAFELALREREIGVLRRRLEAIPAAWRPQTPSGDRFEILRLIRLRGLSVDETAKRYVLHPNTVRDWLRRFHGRKEVGGFFGDPPFHRIHEPSAGSSTRFGSCARSGSSARGPSPCGSSAQAFGSAGRRSSAS